MTSLLAARRVKKGWAVTEVCLTKLSGFEARVRTEVMPVLTDVIEVYSW
jgi:hypothetical protein